MKKLSEMFPTFAGGLVALFFTLVGGVIGATYQQYFQVKLEEEKKILEHRKDAYADFFSGQAVRKYYLDNEGELPQAKRDELDAEYKRLVTKSRFLIAVYSSKSVVDALSYLFRTDKKCPGTQEQWLDEAKVYQSVRRELFGKDKNQQVSDQVLMLLIFACQIPA